MLNFKITNLDINQSYFFGEVEFRSDKYKVNIQNERRGKVLRLPFQIDSKNEKIIVRADRTRRFVCRRLSTIQRRIRMVRNRL